VEQKLKQVMEAFAAETNRRKDIEQQMGEIGERRGELEAVLANNSQVQAQLRQELETSQKTTAVTTGELPR